MTELSDVNTALSALSSEITTFLADVSGQVSGGLTASQAQQVVSQINAFTAQLKSADPGVPPATTKTTTTTTTPTPTTSNPSVRSRSV